MPVSSAIQQTLSTKTIRIAGAVALVIGLCQSILPGQSGLQFEAVSIRPHRKTAVDPFQPSSVLASMPIRQGGPGTANPHRVRYSRYSLLSLIVEAFDLYPDQIDGPPWIRDDQFMIEAVVPMGATMPQLQTMLQHMLSERFELDFELKEKEFPVYSLVVASGGHKLAHSGVAESSTEEDSIADLRRLGRDAR